MAHWLPRQLAGLGAPLAPRLVEMLDEHCSHRTERRGCGFTQATRLLAEHINLERSRTQASDLAIFSGVSTRNIEAAARHWLALGHSGGWRRLAPLAPAQVRGPFEAQYQELGSIRAALQSAAASASDPGSRLILRLIAGVFDGGAGDAPALPPMAVKPEIGSCSQAEEFFLEIAHGKIRRGGSVNVVVDEHGAPLLIEKINLGESHSAISVAALALNEVELPPGSLFALAHAPSAQLAPCSGIGRRLRIEDIEAARFLRTTTLAVAPEVRVETFSAQVEAQIRSNMVSPLSTTLADLTGFARQCTERAA